MLLGGHEWENAPTVALLNPGNFELGNVTPLEIPAETGKGVVLDFAATGTGPSRTLWVLRTTDSSTPGNFSYAGWTIQNVTGIGSTLQSSVRSGTEPWFASILPTTVNGSSVIASDDAAVPVRVPVTP